MSRVELRVEGSHKCTPMQFHDAATREFTTLEYPSKHARPHHPTRNPGEGRFGQEPSVAAVEGGIGLVEQVNKAKLKHILDNHGDYDLGSAYVKGFKHMDKKGPVNPSSRLLQHPRQRRLCGCDLQSEDVWRSSNRSPLRPPEAAAPEHEP